MKATDPEVQASVIAALMTGMAVNETARRYKLSPATVSRIKANLDQEGLKHIETESRRRIDDMLVVSVQSHLDGLKGIAELAQDKNYLRKQSPEGLSTLHQRLEDHAFRLLESAGIGGAEESESD